jgi:hypothetical protein
VLEMVVSVLRGHGFDVAWTTDDDTRPAVTRCPSLTCAAQTADALPQPDNGVQVGAAEASVDTTRSIDSTNRTRPTLPDEQLPSIDIAGALYVTPGARRWADLVMCAVAAASDPRTLDDWRREANLSRATLHNRCRRAGVLAKPSLDFARLLRAAVHASRFDCPAAALLDADPRTVSRLLADAGVTTTSPLTTASLPSAASFVDSQRLITNLEALSAIKLAIATLEPHGLTRRRAAYP